MHELDAYEFHWSGESNYLALHNISLLDGETVMDGFAPVHLMDLRTRMTFAPKGCHVSGWSKPAQRKNNYFALFYDPDIIMEELERNIPVSSSRPMLYFEDRNLCRTLGRLQALVQSGASVDPLLAETLGLLAVFELDSLQNGRGASHFIEHGGLSLRQQHLVQNFIQDNLLRPLSLADLAKAVGLTRFHFARAFKCSFGVSPYKYFQRARVEHAKILLYKDNLPIQQISALLGFTSANQFSRIFRNEVGYTPTEFRRRSK